MENGQYPEGGFCWALMEIHLIMMKKEKGVQRFRVMKEGGSMDPCKGRDEVLRGPFHQKETWPAKFCSCNC